MRPLRRWGSHTCRNGDRITGDVVAEGDQDRPPGQKFQVFVLTENVSASSTLVIPNGNGGSGYGYTQDEAEIDARLDAATEGI